MKVLNALVVLMVASHGVIASESGPIGMPACLTGDHTKALSAATSNSSLSCQPQGACDDPVNRDSAIPGDNSPIKYLRVKFQSLSRDDGSRPAFSRAEAQSAVDWLNDCFEPWHLHFDFDHRMIYSTEFHTIHEDWGAVNEMGIRYAEDNLHALNIFTTYFWCEWQGQMTLCGGAHFPWTHAEGSSFWTVLMTRNHWSFGGLICHEVGHAFGLHHTFGPFDQEPCGACDEIVGAGNGDTTADFCSDTPPTPVNPWNTECAPAPGVDQCSGLPWGETDYRNWMAYTPYAPCKDHFTPQQAGRMHCWLEDRRPHWISYANIQGDVDFGPAPLSVRFESLTSMTVEEWRWDFGDGADGQGSNPTHEYSVPGVYRPRVALHAAEGDFGAEMARDVWVAAGEVLVAAVDANPGDQLINVPIEIETSVPVDFMDLPLRWDGPAPLGLDAVSTEGLRSQYFPTPQWLDYDPVTRRGCLRVRTVDQLALEPGRGVLLNLEFSSDAVNSAVSSTAIRVESYEGCRLQFVTDRGPFTPDAIDGRVRLRPNTMRRASGRHGP